MSADMNFDMSPRINQVDSQHEKYENILIDRLEPGIVVLKINRPKALNALNAAVLRELRVALRALAGGGLWCANGLGLTPWLGRKLCRSRELAPALRHSHPARLRVWLGGEEECRCQQVHVMRLAGKKWLGKRMDAGDSITDGALQ